VTESKAVDKRLAGIPSETRLRKRLVGAESIALAGEHPRRILVLALEGEDAGGIRERPGNVFASSGNLQQFRRRHSKFGSDDLADPGAGE
jgi:hypothetical protein